MVGMLPCVSWPSAVLRTVRPGKKSILKSRKKKVGARLGGSIDVTTGGGVGYIRTKFRY